MCQFPIFYKQLHNSYTTDVIAFIGQEQKLWTPASPQAIQIDIQRKNIRIKDIFRSRP